MLSVQLTVSVSFPIQFRPPLIGNGAAHCLVLVFWQAELQEE